MTDEVQTDRFRNISGHLEDLTGGKMVAAGGFVDLTAEEQNDEFNSPKLAENFVKVEAPVVAPEPFDRDAALARAKELDIVGRTNMQNDVLQTAINEAETKAKAKAKKEDDS